MHKLTPATHKCKLQASSEKNSISPQNAPPMESQILEQISDLKLNIYILRAETVDQQKKLLK